MKKLSLLITLLLCVTITGVYAAWTYAGTNDIADVYAEAKITIADVELVGANGTYHITSNLVLTIDQADTGHRAELIFSANDAQPIYLRVTFTPSENAGQEIKESAVPSELYFGTTTDMLYKMDNDGNYSAEGTPTPILKFANPGNQTLDNPIVWEKDPVTGIFTFEMDEAALKGAISLSQTFVLDTKAEHDAFRTALNGNIVARVTDGIVTEDAPAVTPQS
ncbi:MAG: hypothetical protein J6R61_03980 [Bacteroidales bacterium]|nr:hypothetical protein [Bacteroidales bacterium]MBO7273410.1 hypothetical protein [Clostridia bacterium]